MAANCRMVTHTTSKCVISSTLLLPAIKCLYSSKSVCAVILCLTSTWWCWPLTSTADLIWSHMYWCVSRWRTFQSYCYGDWCRYNHIPMFDLRHTINYIKVCVCVCVCVCACVCVGMYVCCMYVRLCVYGWVLNIIFNSFAVPYYLVLGNVPQLLQVYLNYHKCTVVGCCEVLNLYLMIFCLWLSLLSWTLFRRKRRLGAGPEWGQRICGKKRV